MSCTAYIQNNSRRDFYYACTGGISISSTPNITNEIKWRFIIMTVYYVSQEELNAIESIKAKASVSPLYYLTNRAGETGIDDFSSRIRTSLEKPVLRYLGGDDTITFELKKPFDITKSTLLSAEELALFTPDQRQIMDEIRESDNPMFRLYADAQTTMKHTIFTERLTGEKQRPILRYISDDIATD